MKMEVLIMLVLTRKCQEIVVIGAADGFQVLLKVTVLGIENGKVRLGFEAAEDIPIHRLEVWDRICAGASIGSRSGADTPDWAAEPKGT
jgi:carbon storage regulator CsrA